MKPTHRVAAVAAALVLATGLGVSSAIAQEPQAPPAAPSQEQADQLLEKALQSIEAGNPQTAIDQFLDPLIVDFERMVTLEGPQLYSANTMGEAILYSALNAAVARKGETPRDATVLGGAWSSALHLKGYALIDLERYEEAKATLRHGLEIAPMNPALWNELGAILQLEMNWPEALHAYEQGESNAGLFQGPDRKRVNPLLTRALRGQGYVLIETGELKKAEKIYKRCLKLDPNDALAQKELVFIADLRKQRKAGK